MAVEQAGRVVTAGRTRGTLPNFLVIGAMKSGSTTLYNHLREHRQVFMTDYKEPEFFVEEKTWGRGVEWYARLFAGAGEAAAVGEASTSYAKPTEFLGVPERIHAVVPQVRLIYILRDPVARIQSMYEHMVLTGHERRPVDEAVLQDPKYIGPSLYARTVRNYLELFPRDQLHLMLTDDLQNDPVTALAGVTDFLGLDPEPGLGASTRVDLKSSERRTDRRVKSLVRGVPGAHLAIQRLPAPVRTATRWLATRSSGEQRPRMTEQTRAQLRERLLPDLRELCAFMPAEFDAWGLLDR